MATFTVVDTARSTAPLFATDDWLAAEATAMGLGHQRRRMHSVRGTHPTHEWDDQQPRRCRACGGWDNGSYGSHAPCGYDFEGKSLYWHVERYKADPSARPATADDEAQP